MGHRAIWPAGCHLTTPRRLASESLIHRGILSPPWRYRRTGVRILRTFGYPVSGLRSASAIETCGVDQRSPSSPRETDQRSGLLQYDGFRFGR